MARENVAYAAIKKTFPIWLHRSRENVVNRVKKRYGAWQFSRHKTHPVEEERNADEREMGEKLIQKYEERQLERIRPRQLEEEKIQRIARQEEIRLNEMRAKERMLAKERLLQRRGRR
ncbi:MAG: hypothetical protein QME12_03645 [Nanoarchaeota archaeon]|nr:hypothetical protein [Nanoarchaeota archaeon]